MERSREAAWCCGAGGACREAFPEYSAATAAERVEEAASTGAEALVTACSRCELNFTEAVAADAASGGPGAGLKVHDVLELVALSAGVSEGGVMSPSYAKPTTPAEMAAQSAKLSDEAYRALEDIVGADNVSRDAAVLDTYAFQWLAELVRPDQSHYMPRPAAAVLPGSTEEVQAIVRLANKYGLKVKPHGTGWYHWSGPVKDSDATLQLDMRRMNAIVEIDEQNMYAVVEPYVIAAQLQAEILPLGLNLNIPGVRLLQLDRRQRLRLPRRRPGHVLHGRQRRERARHGVGHAGGRDRPHRLARLGRRLVLQRGPRPVRARHLPGHARQPRRARRVHQVRGQARPALRPDRVERRGHAAGVPPARAREPARLHARRARTGTPGPRSTTGSTTTRSATSSTASSTWPAPTSPPPSG